MRADPLSVIEAAYTLDGAWLPRLLEAAHRELGRGLGLIGFTYHLRDGLVAVDESGGAGVAPEVATAMAEGAHQLPRFYVAETFGRVSACTTSHSGGAEARQLGRRLMGGRDMFVVNGLDPTGHGVFLGANLAAVTKPLPAETRLWGRVAAHLASAHRLRRRLGEDAEAVLTPSGRVEHAGAAAQSRDVRARLRAAVRDLDRARAQLRRRDPPRAVEIWKGLVSARWSLVEQFESDGRRYLLARRNDSQVGGIDALSDRERQVVGFAALGHTNKLIAYELGIAAGTVGALLHRAARKLGARSRPETIQIFLAHVARFDRST